MVELTKAIDILEKVNATDIKVFNFTGKSHLYDYFLIGTVNDRASQAALSYFNKEMKDNIRHIEGRNTIGWVLVDLGDIVVHLFGKDEREFYGFDQRFMEFVKNWTLKYFMTSYKKMLIMKN